MSKTQFPLPKGVEINNIEIDVKNNLLTIVYEEEKPVLKVGEWYKYLDQIRLVIDEDLHRVGFNKKGKWIENDGDTKIAKCCDWKPADMKEVKKLLIKEAEKRGFKDGVMCKPPFKNAYKRKVVGELRLHERGSVIDANENILFEPTTGNWAEIIPEKKPIEKPPLGIMPIYIWKEKRREELARAITRYNTASLVIPNEWIEELKSIK